MTSVRAESGPPPVTGATRVCLHPLSMRPDDAVGKEAWIIGRADTGEFISAPPIARRAICLLAQGSTVTDVRAKLRADGSDVDIADFVATLAELGFLSHINDHPVDQPAASRPTLPRLKPRHVRWLLHPAVPIAAIAIIIAAAAAMALRPALVPGYRDLLWSRSGGVVILGNAVIGWTIIFLHELSHLSTARGADVYATMSLSTRLQFLVAQTDVSGVWAAPRRVRITVYLAGMTTNLIIAAACVLGQAATSPSGVTHDLLAAAALLSLISVPLQFLIFMRTDVYFLIQDLTGCANLYADGSAYLRYQTKRLWRFLLSDGPPPADPSRHLSRRERLAVRGYAIILIAGTATCLFVAAITWSTAITLLTRAVTTITSNDRSATKVFDAVTVLTVTGVFQILWIRAWWRKHGHRIHRVLAHHPRPKLNKRR